MKKLMLLFAIFSILGLQVYAQNTVTGKVIDDAGEALPGVSVIVKGTTIGTMTLGDGTYSIDVPEGSNTLVFSYIGMETQEVTITGDVIDVTMKTASEFIEEVVVTGVASGTSTKKVGFAINKVNADLLDEVPAVDAGNALRGKVSGVTVVQGSGNPLTAPSIRLRGSTTITGSQEPLIIVDGIITNGSLADINMQDVKSIEIVKGSAGASLYGSLAGNGVIQIITKRGLESDGMKITVRNEFGKQSLQDEYPLTTKHAYLLNDDGSDFVYSGDTSLNNRVADPDYLMDNDYPSNYPVYDPQEMLFKPQSFYTNYISIANNFEKFNFATSFENSYLGGVIDGLQPYQRRNLRVNFDYMPIERLKFSFSGSYINVNGRETTELGQGANMFYSVLTMEPIFDLTADNPDGTPYIAAPENYNGNWSNPLYVAHNKIDDLGRDRFMGGMSVSYKVFDWLKVMADYSTDIGSTTNELYYFKGYLTPNPMDNTRLGYQSLWNRYTTANIYSVSALLEKSFGKINSKFVTKYMWEDYMYRYFYAKGENFSSNVRDMSAGAPDQYAVNYYLSETKAENIFGDLTLDYDDKIILDGMVRRDGSSRFGSDTRYKIYYRGSVAYRLSEDISIPGINEFKIRASYGTSGMRPPFYAQYETYSVSSSGIAPNILGNKLLKPTEVAELETGVNIDFLNKFSFEANYAIANAKDQYMLVPLVPAAGGFTAQWQNAGTVQSKNLEFSLNGKAVNKKDFKVNFGITFGRTRQTITELNAPAYTRDFANTYGTAINLFRVEEGEPFGVMYGNQIVESIEDLTLDENGYVINDPNYNADDPTNNITVDDVTINSDGYVIRKGTENTVNEQPYLIVNSEGIDSIMAIGNSNAKFNMGFSSTVTYKNFGLYFLIDWKNGGDVYNYTKQLLYYNNRSADYDMYAAQGKKVNYINASSVIYNKSNAISHFVEDGSYVKLREISISYNLKKENLGFLGKYVNSVKFGLHGRNLYTFTNYTGWDPEVAVGGDSNWAYDEYSYPNYRSFSVSLNITF